MRKLRRKIMLSGVIASTIGVALAGTVGVVVAAVAKAKKKAAEAEAVTESEEIAEACCPELSEEACSAEIDL